MIGFIKPIRKIISLITMNTPDDLHMKKPEWPESEQWGRELAAHVKEVSSTDEPVKIVAVLPNSITKGVVAMATNVWRIRSKLLDSTTTEAREEISKDDLRKLSRYIDATLEAFNGMGFEIKDRTGEIFDYGLPEKVVTAQPREGLSKEMIVETIRPTIYFKDQIAQQGEVVIATPVSDSAKKE